MPLSGGGLGRRDGPASGPQLSQPWLQTGQLDGETNPQPLRSGSHAVASFTKGKISHTRNQHLRNHRGFSVAFSNELSLVSDMFQRIHTFPVDFHWNYPMDFQCNILPRSVESAAAGKSAYMISSGALPHLSPPLKPSVRGRHTACRLCCSTNTEQADQT